MIKFSYEIPISESKTAEPKKHFIAAGFLSLGDTKSTSVRRIEYIIE